MKDTRNKIHYAKFYRVSYSICGLAKYGIFRNGNWVKGSEHYELELTRNKKKVTCKNCKRTKLFRGVK